MDKEKIGATPEFAKGNVTVNNKVNGKEAKKKVKKRKWKPWYKRGYKGAQSKGEQHKEGKHKGPKKWDVEKSNETSYCLKDGLRFVFPYHYEFKSEAKKEWLDNMTILDVLSNEIGKGTKEDYEEAMKRGRIKVDDEVVTEDRVLKTGEKIISNMAHRHEPPVVHQEIEFIQNGDKLVVIDKPSSIPVYPVGRYRHNSILFILAKEYNLTGLTTLHRINPLASGILMFAKTDAKAKELRKKKQQIVKKKYLARVVGEFPSGKTIVNEPVLLHIPLSHFGLGHVHPDGKPSLTKFKLIKYNGKSSLVSCEPAANRESQIRIHLHHLGHPIINDPIYNNPTLWVKQDGTYNMVDVVQEFLRTRSDKMYYSLSKPSKLNSEDIQVNDDTISEEGAVCHKKRKLAEGIDSGCCKEADKNEKGRSYYASTYFSELYSDENCDDCKRKWRLPTESDLVMYLHSFHHREFGLDFKTSIPDWAREDWDSC